MHDYYNRNLKEYARELRTSSISKAEKYIWKHVLSRGRTGVKFKRQRPIDRFIVDFFAAEIGLIVEIDGNSHQVKGGYDVYRERRLNSLGYQFLRFNEGEVMQNIGSVMERIGHAVYCLREEKGVDG